MQNCMKTIKRVLSMMAMLTAALSSCSAADHNAQVGRTKWYREAKFGMFIHWGPYSLASVEASWPIMAPDPKWSITEAEYRSLQQRFDPEVRRQGLGSPSEGRRPALHGLHHETSRWFLHVRLLLHRLQGHQHGLHAGRRRGTSRSQQKQRA